jgi:uncharacterized protein YprB with RNaseH-like and TPR domain
MYSPKIEDRIVTKLYLLKRSLGLIGIRKFMTTIVREALCEYIPKVENEILKAGGRVITEDDLEQVTEWRIKCS